MTPMKGSPNWHWQELGATIERVKAPYKHRVITLPDGRSFCPVALDVDGHAAEIALAKKLTPVTA